LCLQVTGQNPFFLPPLVSSHYSRLSTAPTGQCSFFPPPPHSFIFSFAKRPKALFVPVGKPPFFPLPPDRTEVTARKEVRGPFSLAAVIVPADFPAFPCGIPPFCARARSFSYVPGLLLRTTFRANFPAKPRRLFLFLLCLFSSRAYNGGEVLRSANSLFFRLGPRPLL